MCTFVLEESDYSAIDFPLSYLTLLVSGGHNMVLLTKGLGDHIILGSTLDDSVGEAFDKTARLLKITQVPGGPRLEKMAKEGNDKAFQLPKPLCNSRDEKLRTGCDFSFSGLKTGVKAVVEKHLQLGEDLHKKLLAEEAETGETPDVLAKSRCDMAASFQRVAVDHLVERTGRAVARARDRCAQAGLDPVKTMVVAGGVAANGLVRSKLGELAEKNSLEILLPPLKYCVDNGVMVAWTGVERLKQGLFDDPPATKENVRYFTEVIPKWPLGPRDKESVNFKEEISKKMREKAAQNKLPKRSREEEDGEVDVGGADTSVEGLSKRGLKRLKKKEEKEELLKKKEASKAGEQEEESPTEVKGEDKLSGEAA